MVGVVVVVELTGMVSDSNLKRYVDTAFRVYAFSADSAQNVKTQLKIFIFQELFDFMDHTHIQYLITRSLSILDL